MIGCERLKLSKKLFEGGSQVSVQDSSSIIVTLQIGFSSGKSDSSYIGVLLAEVLQTLGQTLPPKECLWHRFCELWKVFGGQKKPLLHYCKGLYSRYKICL